MFSLLLVTGFKITRDTPMAHRIGTVWCKPYFKNLVIFHFIKFGNRSTGNQLVIHYQDTFVTLPQTQFFFRTDHTVTGFSTNFSFFNFPGFSFFIVKNGSNSCYRNFLSRCNIGCSANDLYFFAISKINLGKV